MPELALTQVCDLLEQATRADTIPAAALCVGRKEGIHQTCFFGRQRPGPGIRPCARTPCSWWRRSPNR